MQRLRQENYFPAIVAIHFLLWAVDLAMYDGSFHDAEADTLLFGSYASPPGTLNGSRIVGEMFSSWVVTVFAFNFLMATRAAWVERLFGGLDKMYVIHRRSGVIAVVLLLLHFVFVPRDLGAFTVGKPLGFWALVGILVGVVLAAAPPLVKRIPYQRWLPSHRLMGVFYACGVAHAFLVHALIWELPLVRTYVFGMALLGVAAWIYKTFLHRFVHPTTEHRITSVQRHGDVLEIELDGRIDHEAGQFAFLTLPSVSREAHPFTIASAPGTAPRFFIKALGDDTSAMPERLKKGDLARVEAPYGHFVGAHTRHERQVWIAGGIGVTPFLAMMPSASPSHTLYWSVKTASEPMVEAVKELAARLGFTWTLWDASDRGHLSIADLGELDWGSTSFLLCGPPAMKEAFRSALLTRGVHRDDIHDEAFAFRS